MVKYYAHPTAEIAKDAIIGDGTKIWHHVHIREGVRIGDNCVLGKGVYIDKNVIIGNRVKIENGVSIYQGVSLEDEVLIGPNATFTNDLFPRSVSPNWKIVPTVVHRGASVGANATVLCGVEIGEYAMIGAGAVVTANVLPFSLMVGNPARLKGFVCVCGHLLIPKDLSSLCALFVCEKCGRELTVRFELKNGSR